jgi:ribulose 1,5-bisphosphate synthetase/thiazole synthase
MKKRSISRRGFLRSSVIGTGASIAGSSAIGAQAAAVRSAASYPALDNVDILVVGGGPAGIGAALGAARTGAKTLLIENHSFFGGVASWMLGMEINQIRPSGKPRSAVHELLVEKLVGLGDQAVIIGTVNGHELWCNVEYLKVAVLDALESVGAKYLVHVRAVDALVEKNRVTGVIIGTKRGLMTIRARMLIDCTGDADVAHYAGAETMIDPKSLMPATLALALANVDKAKVKGTDIAAAIKGARKKHPLIPSGFLEIRPIVKSSSWFINHSGTADMGRVDVTDPVERTKAECQSRRQALQMAQALRESDNPAIAQIEWVAGGPQLAVRESRRVKGIYVVTEADARGGQKFDDVIAWRSGLMDPGGEIGGPGGGMKTHDIPYRAIVPETMDGLLVGGRCISTTHVAAAAAKSMGNCMATGHAAALAASIAIKNGIQPREIKVKELQDKLRADGVNLEFAH